MRRVSYLFILSTILLIVCSLQEALAQTNPLTGCYHTIAPSCDGGGSCIVVTCPENEDGLAGSSNCGSICTGSLIDFEYETTEYAQLKEANFVIDMLGNKTGGEVSGSYSLLINGVSGEGKNFYLLHAETHADKVTVEAPLNIGLRPGKYEITIAISWGPSGVAEGFDGSLLFYKATPEHAVIYDEGPELDPAGENVKVYVEPETPLYDTYTTMQVQLNSPPLTNLDEYRVVLYDYDNNINANVLAMDGIKDPRKITFPTKDKFEGFNAVCDQYRQVSNSGQCIMVENAKYSVQQNRGQEDFDWVCGLGNGGIEWEYMVNDIDNDGSQDFQFHFTQKGQKIGLSKLYPPGFLPVMYTNEVGNNAYAESVPFYNIKPGQCIMVDVPFEGLTLAKTNPESKMACTSRFFYEQVSATKVKRVNLIACTNCAANSVKFNWSGAKFQGKVQAGTGEQPIRVPGTGIGLGGTVTTETGFELVPSNPLSTVQNCSVFDFTYPFAPDILNSPDQRMGVESLEEKVERNRADVSGRLFQIYPNPVADVGQMEFNLPAEQEVTIELYDVHGRHIKTMLFAEVLPAGAYKMSIPTSDIPTGSYIMQLQTSEGLEDHHRLFKQ